MSSLNLTPYSYEQRQAILAGDGPLLLLAGPGSGKTAVLTARIGHLIHDRRVEPERILAITFSRKAARELHSRLVADLHGRGEQVHTSTFHAFGLGVIRIWSRRLGYPSSQLAVIGTAKARQVLAEAAEAVGTTLLPETAPQIERLRLSLDTGVVPADVGVLARAYQTLLRERGLIDYAAMLTDPMRLFALLPDALAAVQQSYHHILVDEVQDVCVIQYRLLRHIAALHHNQFLVGDVRQMLYGWRGAHLGLLDDFRRDFPTARCLALSHNFRSTGRIVALANALGETLPGHHPLWTANPPGIQPRVILAPDAAREAAWIGAEILRLHAGGAIRYYNDVAILVRLNRQKQALADTLRQHHIPVQGAFLSDKTQPDDTAAPLPDEDTAPVDPQAETSLEAFLDAQDAATPEPAPEPGVWVGTIHAAKGMEWPVVFVAGCEEGLLPHALARPPELVADGMLDEERCVFYVAVTRARERLYLSASQRRARGTGMPEARTLSRYITALPHELFAWERLAAERMWA